MKKILVILIITSVTFPILSQSLLDSYKSGAVVLSPDETYAQNNDWNVVFKTYYDTIHGKPRGDRKSLMMMPDGSVLVNHDYRDYFSVFSPDGTFKNEVSIKGKVGVPKKHAYNIAGVLNGSILYSGLDNLGNMLCLDMNGNYQKKLKLDYVTEQMITISSDKIAVVGWVLWKDKVKEFVAIVDYNTNEQLEVWERFSDRNYILANDVERPLFNYTYKFPEGGSMSCTTMPFSKRKGLGPSVQIATLDQKLMVAIPITGEILVYDFQGNLVAKDKMEWTKQYISVEEQKEIQKNAIEKYKNEDFSNMPRPNLPEERKAKWFADLKKAYDYLIPQMEEDLEKISKPIPLPVFSTIIKDSDDNLLFFEYPKEEGKNKFNVWIYKNDGSFICKSSFQCDDYELQINPSKMVFHNGYIYSLQTLKKATGVPLRLVRFKLES